MEKKILKQIKRIEIQATKLAEDKLIGPYHSIFKGKGIEFEEVKEYQPGDDVRYIDWNVSARMQHPFIKTFREEREICVMLIVDASGSNKFGEKSEWIAEIGAVLSYSAIKNNDKVGLILFSDQIEKFIPPNKGSHHILRLVRELLLFKPKHQKTNIQLALQYFFKTQKQSAICFVISDFFDDNFDKIMRLLTKKHDMIAIQITDPLEHKLPQVGLLCIKDLESGNISRVDTNDPNVNKSLNKQLQKHALYIKKIASQTAMDLIQIEAGKPYMPILQKFFKKRKKQLG